ncbi:MAG: MoaD/ThiS family protein [Rhodospirillales bacterium]|nr:MoaD/ThiS family protein [Rhodospirillales bacterium]MBO6786203.1 MoaD/ThiS family protein [Rhodospirillales bacterium]
MKIRIKLYASLAEYLPADAVKNEADLEVNDGTTPTQVISRLGLPERMCHMVLVNGVYIAPDERLEKVLEEGDHLAIWPPVAGG